MEPLGFAKDKRTRPQPAVNICNSRPGRWTPPWAEPLGKRKEEIIQSKQTAGFHLQQCFTRVAIDFR